MQADFSLGTILGTGSVAITLTGQAATAAVGALSPPDVMGLAGVSAASSV